VNRYSFGVCHAIADIWGAEKMMTEFGGRNVEEAIRNCIELAKDNARAFVEKWLEKWPQAMARTLKEQV